MVDVMRSCGQQGGGPRPLSPPHPGYCDPRSPDLVLNSWNKFSHFRKWFQEIKLKIPLGVEQRKDP